MSDAFLYSAYMSRHMTCSIFQRAMNNDYSIRLLVIQRCNCRSIWAISYAFYLSDNYIISQIWKYDERKGRKKASGFTFRIKLRKIVLFTFLSHLLHSVVELNEIKYFPCAVDFVFFVNFWGKAITARCNQIYLVARSAMTPLISLPLIQPN